MGSLEEAAPATKRLSQVLLKVTLFLAVSLGIVSGILQVWVDLRQEKDAVQYSAHEFLESVTPSAASAAYNFYFDAAERVVDGLFTQRAISGVTIINEGEEMIARSRDVVPTLPALGFVTQSDEISISEPLRSPADDAVIGSITIVVDRSIVPPAIVKRLLMYFILATLKNTALGLLLIAVVYGALARHIISLAEAAGNWTPDRGALDIRRPPKLLAGTELELLGNRIEQLTVSASGKIKEAEQSRLAAVKSNSELSERSETLSKAIEIQNLELQRTNTQLKEMAEKDALTGLCNRRSFDQRAQDFLVQASEEDLELCAFLLDVDHFKAYNDFYGHQAGDECLQSVAGALKSCALQNNAFVARYGGEEFVLLFASRDENAKYNLAAAIHQHIKNTAIPHERSAVSSEITVSVGCASNADWTASEKWSLDRLVSSADDALYEAKRGGRNKTEFSTFEMRQRTRDERARRRRLLEAVQNVEFEPFFQPQIDAGSGKVAGIEVLSRWIQPDGSVRGPDSFVSTAIECGFITQIDTIVLEAARKLLGEAGEQGLSIPRLSLNVPKENLSVQGYVQALIELSRGSETPIAVELLETAMFDDATDEFAVQLDLLREADIEIEIDDFGTGHTSLISLMTIKPSRLKIAKELVLPMLESKDHHQLVVSVIELGRTLDIEVLAEGVETERLAAELAEYNCLLHQGYHYARPMPAKDLLGFLEKGKAQIGEQAA